MMLYSTCQHWGIQDKVLGLNLHPPQEPDPLQRKQHALEQHCPLLPEYMNITPCGAPGTLHETGTKHNTAADELSRLHAGWRPWNAATKKPKCPCCLQPRTSQREACKRQHARAAQPSAGWRACSDTKRMSDSVTHTALRLEHRRDTTRPTDCTNRLP